MAAMLNRMLRATNTYTLPGRGPLCEPDPSNINRQNCDPTATTYPVVLWVDVIEPNQSPPGVLMQAMANDQVIFSMILGVEGLTVKYVEDSRSGRSTPWVGTKVLTEEGGELVSTPAPKLCDNGQCPQVANPDVYVPEKNWACIRQGGSYQRPTVCYNGVTNGWYVSSAGRSAAAPPLVWGQID